MTMTAAQGRLAKRRRKDSIFAVAGAVAVALTLLWILFLFTTLTVRAIPAMTTTELRLEIRLDPERIPANNPRRGDWRNLLAESLNTLLPETATREEQKLARNLPSKGTIHLLRNTVAENPGLIGTTRTFWIPVADPLDQYRKGLLAPAENTDGAGVTILSPEQAALFDTLRAQNKIRTRPSWRFFRNPDSRFPALAGIAGAAVGSTMAILVCFLVAFPVGVAAAVWFEEFAPRGKRTDLFRINVYNLAAVPSIIFGLLGLSVFLNLFGMVRGSPLVGGLVLALMTLPIIVVVSSAAIGAVPREIRDAALALGASRQEAMRHHTLPYALPGILTGAIIGLARAFGETAPLLLIGMNAFLATTPASFTAPATALPAQIFLWADQPERGFVSRTSAAILALLVLLFAINLAAILMRYHFENKRRRGR
ncbi:MAG: phosphate ABC transporter permease PstA [Alphaproteobacteria bacterium]|nr:phosphate ABC transporter permease PstA [Alphaproteobacteria bacterium]